MQSRLTFRVSGDNFNAQKCINELTSNELITQYDSEFPNYLVFTHPNEFSEYWDELYEKAFLNFIQANIVTMQNNGADNFSIFTEMYIDSGEQCNFEILSPEFYQFILKYNIGLPVSVYVVPDNVKD
jgi:chloramphenicol O-acetyltransferase